MTPTQGCSRRQRTEIHVFQANSRYVTISPTAECFGSFAVGGRAGIGAGSGWVPDRFQKVPGRFQ